MVGRESRHCLNFIPESVSLVKRRWDKKFHYNVMALSNGLETSYPYLTTPSGRQIRSSIVLLAVSEAFSPKIILRES